MSDFEQNKYGKYHLLEKIATGEDSEIFLAETVGVDGHEKKLAIKLLSPGRPMDKDSVDMVIDEAKLSVLFNHENIVHVYDLGRVGDQYFMSMEYIKGSNLRDILAGCNESKKPFLVEHSLYIVSEICKGLDYIHHNTDAGGMPLKIVWRNLCPKHVMISDDGKVKLLDFSIAKAAFNISRTMGDILKGEIPYMSPEQALGGAIDSRSDIFSVGTLLYELLTGANPFLGDTNYETLKNIRSRRMDMTLIPDSIPEPLRIILSKALAHDVEHRYASAGDMQTELMKYLCSNYDGDIPQALARIVRDITSC